ncbi:uridine diphosphate-N-acetylglucosamine-binding protein YvcK [Shewanella electrodiphila]|uniref:Putative gluconeogenesis factor n=1 Tax=Shewanella electrodiphila TaxID=934143 RepID=A0ABT0KSZ3_9GAMM|nr:uridine diphosphate-N-acetylglucosamine-binding protein YvcK [Shewanella electrodiphila]MCL1046883.1 uridine diphosphate-N-acetylglucosamine-binding protein YvcK [Shewanella electrodiphila]
MMNQPLQQYDHVIALGGGHGLGRVLAALSFLGPKLTGIVTTTDNGGSTGRIRQDQTTIAWGDLRNCLSQLANRPSIGTMLFDHRFNGDNELNGHNLGNIILYALEQLCVRPLEAIKLIRTILKIDTRIIPMSEEPTHLTALNVEGQMIFGETNVDEMSEVPSSLNLEPQVTATCEAIQAINKAELIIIGPGSFLTSVLPPLLLPAIATAISNSNAQIIFIDNLTNEVCAANKLLLEDKLNWINQLLGRNAVNNVISHAEHIDVGEFVSFFPLVSDHHAGLHNKEALATALSTVMNKST